MKIITNDGGSTYKITEANLQQDSYYSVNIKKEGYKFTIPDTYVPIPYVPLPVTTKAKNTAKIKTIKIIFDYNVPNLLVADMEIIPSVNINTISSNDNGLNYSIQGDFEQGQEYTFSFNKYGYDFKNTVSIKIFGKWEKVYWSEIFSKLGLPTYTDTYGIVGSCFLRRKFFIVGYGPKNLNIGSTDTNWGNEGYIITEDGVNWAKLNVPYMTNRNIMDIESSFSLVGLNDTLIYYATTGRSMITSDTGGYIYYAKINHYNDKLDWVEIIDESSWAFYDDNDRGCSLNPRTAGRVGSYYWVDGLYNSDIPIRDTDYNTIRISSAGAIRWGYNGLSKSYCEWYRPSYTYGAGSSYRFLACIAAYDPYGSNIGHARLGTSANGYTTDAIMDASLPRAGSYILYIDNGYNGNVQVADEMVNTQPFVIMRYNSSTSIQRFNIPYPLNKITSRNCFTRMFITPPSNINNSRYFICLPSNLAENEPEAKNIAYFSELRGQPTYYQQIFDDNENNYVPKIYGFETESGDRYCAFQYFSFYKDTNYDIPYYYISPLNYEFIEDFENEISND